MRGLWPRRGAGVAGVAFVVLAATARGTAALPVDAGGQVTVGGGYDTNLFLDVIPDPTSPRYHAAAGAFGRAAPSLSLRVLPGSWRLELRYDADLRQTSSSGLLAFQGAALEARAPALGPLRLRAGAYASRFDPTSYAEDRFTEIAAAASADLRPVVAARAWLRGRLTLREYPGGAGVDAERDTVYAADAGAAWLPSPTVEAAVTAGYMGIRASAVESALDRGRLGLDAGAFLRPLRLSGAAWAGIQRVASTRDDRQWGASAGVGWGLGDHVDVVLAYDFLESTSSDPAAGVTRHVVSLSLVGRGSLGHAAGGADPAVVPGPDAPKVRDGSVTFQLRAPSAQRVEVVGSWDGWARAQALTPADAGHWQAIVDLPPGRHRYRFLVDGLAVRPPGATAYENDDWGGEDGIVVIEEARSSGD